MSRKVKTPKFVVGDFSLNIWFILTVAIIMVILAAGLKATDTTVYKDNHIKAKYENEKLIIKNSNEVDINVMILNNQHKFDVVVGAKSTETDIELLPGISKVFVSCKYFEDNFEVSRE